MHHLMWILTWIAVGIGGALGAASVIMLSAAHQPGGQSPSVTQHAREQPVMATGQKTGEPARRQLLTSHRHNAATADEGTAGAHLTE
jgi:hypothetical protein